MRIHLKASAHTAAWWELPLSRCCRSEGFVNGLSGPFHKGLPDKFWTLPPPVNPTLLATAFRDGCNAGVLLEFIGAQEALALFAKGGEQTWRQVWTGSR